MANRDILRIAREVAEIQKGTDLSIAVASQESDMRCVQALIIGPPGTPYEFGFFEFVVKFGPEYPSKPPKVEARTTNRGQCRFNPNIYAGGKVCLSILGTWPGQAGEQWSSAQGLESILLSIQSLMSSNPYENEPGFEDSKGDVDKKIREDYCAKIQHETLRIAVLQKLEHILCLEPLGSTTEAEPSEVLQSDTSTDEEEEAKTDANELKKPTFTPFNDLLKRRFLWYYDTYSTTIANNAPEFADGTPFKRVAFESRSNGMSGKFCYVELAKRFARVKEMLGDETRTWASEGQIAIKSDLHIAYNLRNQFNHFGAHQHQKNMHNVIVNLLDDSPFVWMITYFGRSGSNLDGGMFRIRMSLSPRFPDEQPRVQFETKIYHHRVSKDGVLCYFPVKIDEVKYHIEGIVSAIEEVSPPYDPRATVNPDATKLFWGSPDDKKQYSRAQRRSAQDSMDEAVA